jgi:hypothetical protein
MKCSRVVRKWWVLWLYKSVCGGELEQLQFGVTSCDRCGFITAPQDPRYPSPFLSGVSR